MIIFSPFIFKHFKLSRKDAGNHFFGRSLAVRTGNCDNRNIFKSFTVKTGNISQGQGSIFNFNKCDALLTAEPLSYYATDAFADHFRDKIMTVKFIALNSHEGLAFFHAARIYGNASHDSIPAS